MELILGNKTNLCVDSELFRFILQYSGEDNEIVENNNINLTSRKNRLFNNISVDFRKMQYKDLYQYHL